MTTNAPRTSRPMKAKTPTTTAYRSIEVLVNRPGLKIYAKDGYYPAPAAR